ncbi:Mth938-like domain-containing protein [Azospirillum halopraeferens]|uniref:Mth938-like domain-containing protein n=1 Tax=Azospirillum halopraeferens TaxID=34010 RepID=UPI00040297FE|nr:Mth938-like domain-containing protein [Azospirillum halopraeferens]
MDITPLIPHDRFIIDGYGEGQISVAGTWRSGPVIVFPHRALDWEVDGVASLTPDSFRPVLEEQPKVEVLLLGCGPRAILPPPEVRRALRPYGLTLEPMDTGAACRTYNVLMAEGRRVAAALFPV